ncbi:hypothetical protein ABG768_000849, partial [Culter alburnus]
TDASDRGLGAVLSQEIEGEERPVLYISRKLSKRETKYSTVEKECLAIRWAVLTLRYYLLGREFTLCSDHGGGLQAGWLPGLSRAVGVCGKGGVVQRTLQRGRASGDARWMSGLSANNKHLSLVTVIGVERVLNARRNRSE